MLFVHTSLTSKFLSIIPLLGGFLAVPLLCHTTVGRYFVEICARGWAVYHVRRSCSLPFCNNDSVTPDAISTIVLGLWHRVVCTASDGRFHRSLCGVFAQSILLWRLCRVHSRRRCVDDVHVRVGDSVRAVDLVVAHSCHSVDGRRHGVWLLPRHERIVRHRRQHGVAVSM